MNFSLALPVYIPSQDNRKQWVPVGKGSESGFSWSYSDGSEF